jgi:hypothetical protein
MAGQNKTLGERFKANWQAILLALITTGLGGEILGVWDNLIIREDDYIEKYVNSIKGKYDEISECNRKLLILETRLSALEMSQGEIPFPYWVKDEAFNIIHLSKEYQRQVLKPLDIHYDSVIGTKGQAFGEDFYNTIIANDKEVRNKHKLLKFEEHLPDGRKGTSYKYPIPTPFGREYYGGIWIPYEIMQPAINN